MFAWFFIVSLLVFSAVGALRTRNATLVRYAIFIYVCAAWWAAIPIVTGDWIWSLLLWPIGLGVARVMIRRRATNGASRPTVPPAV